MEYLRSESSSSPLFQQAAELYDKKLWYQLSLLLEDLIKLPSLQSSAALSKFHSQFLHKLNNKINHLTYTTLSIHVSRAVSSHLDAVKFLETIKAELPNSGAEQSAVQVELEISRRMINNSQLEEVKDRLTESKVAIDKYSGVMATSIYSLFYLTHLEYHKIKGTPQEYFNNALLYLTYTPLQQIDSKQQLQLAQDISLSALLGAQIYNFGEFLQHPIIEILNNNSDSNINWIPKMLQAFNSGNIDQFQQIFNQIKGQNALLNLNADFLQQKIRIMALIELIFTKHNNLQGGKGETSASAQNQGKSLSFAELAKHCQVPVPDVELLLMKALSLHVIKGSINEIEQRCSISWVQPRVLNKAQITAMQQRIQNWVKQVDEAIILVQNNAEQILNPSFP
jgi:26S proteasome regulatory subunit N9